jgi:hypothetical protein
MDFKIVFLIILLLVMADKLTTIANIKLLQHKAPHVDSLQAEKNPVAKFFFSKFGLWIGTILFSFFSLALYRLVYYFFSVRMAEVWALYIIVMIHALVVTNNIFWLIYTWRVT